MRIPITAAAHATAILLAATSGALAAQVDADFIKQAIQGDNTEIMMGQLAAQQGSTADVKSFGQTLVRDHTRAKQDMMNVAKQVNAPVEDAPTPDADAIKAKLSTLSGRAFDGAFADAMINDHQKDIALYRRESDMNDGAVSTLATQQLPVLEKHLQMAEDIRTSEAGGALAAHTGAQTGFLAQEGDHWRGSKLIGTTIYGPNDKQVGDINDVLVGRDGRIDYVIVGVGGFLGIGEKNVAIPFDRVTFSQQPNQAVRQNGNAVASADNGLVNAAVPANRTTAGAPMPNAAHGQAVNTPPVVQARGMASPDHGLIDYTADQLKSAPTFNYAR